MGNHAKNQTKPDRTRLKGYRVIQQLEGLELVPNPWNGSWLKFASRLQSLGALEHVDASSRTPKLFVSVDASVIKSMLSGRRIARRFPKVAAFGLTLPVLLVLGVMPLGSKPSVQSDVVTSKIKINSCSPETIGKWLQGSGESQEIMPLGTSVLGGVTVGTLECKGSRYSYTLGSEEPKRVLKLQKLNS